VERFPLRAEPVGFSGARSHFVVNALAHDQVELSNKFAETHENKFAEID
jgi:hypothetical protein